jgi:hypothetical protein
MPAIRIDTSALTYPWFWLPGHLVHFLDGSVPGGASVSLDPGDYTFQQTRQRACDVHFRVTPQGTVEYTADQSEVLGGYGTDTLHVLGVPVTLRPKGAAGALLPLWGGCHEPIADEALTVRMPPGVAYELRLAAVATVAGAVVEFAVGRDGAVDYPSHHEEALSGRGTGILTVDLDTLART